MSNIHNIEDYREGEFLFAALAMCVEQVAGEVCFHRWIAGVPKDTSLFRLECPGCGAQNSFASILPSEYLGEFIGERDAD